jgi:septal ring factor EnvC (AmiA/AmiB activator)
MDDAQVRERVLQWVDEAREVLGLVPQLIDGERDLGAKSAQTEKENEVLRHELTTLRKELSEARAQHGDLQREVEDLRTQNEVLRGEKDEAAQALAKVLETVQATNQIAVKLGVTRSPFARSPQPQPAAPTAAPAE